ncbi:MAG: hypothetical protein EBZ73_00155, partial [Burkholderiaceae bacterium]|nr:hypothetical protein [Burkholderiaceae bacterium]
MVRTASRTRGGWPLSGRQFQPFSVNRAKGQAIARGIDRVGIGPAADRGLFGWFGDGRYLYSTCYIGNLCEAIVQALKANLFTGTFFIRDKEEMNLREFLSARLQASNYAVPTLSIPRAMAWPLARFTENGWNCLPLKGQPPL